MSRTGRFLSGITLGFSGQVLMIVVGLWLTPFLLHRITGHGYGLWVVATQIMTYLMLMDLGVVALLPRETAYETGKAGGVENASRLPLVVGATTRIVLWQWPAVAAASLLVLFLLPASWADLRQPLAIILGAFVFFFPFRVLHAVLEGLQDLAYTSRIFILSWGLNITLAVLLVLAGWGLHALAAGWIAGQVVSALAWAVRFPTHFPDVLPRRLPALPWNRARQQLGKGLWVSAGQVAHTLVSGTEVLIIGKFFGPAAVVPYVCTAKLVSVLSNQPAMLMRTAMPALSELRHAESREKLFRVATALGLAMLATSGAVFAVVVAINEGFVKWWVGPQQYGGFLLTVMLCVAMMVRHLNVSVGYAIFSFGHERHLAITAIMDGVATVAATAALVWWIGPVGAPIASIAGATLIGLRRNLRPLAADTSSSIARLAVPILPWFGRFLIVLAAVLVMLRFWSPTRFLELAATGAVVGTAYLLVVWPAVMRSPLGEYVRPRLESLRDRFRAALPQRRPDP